MRACPTLVTERLTLRAHAESDFDDLHAVWSDPEVVRFIGGKPSTPADTWTRLLRYAGMWTIKGFGYWRVGETATGRYVGDIGLMDARREIDPPLGDVPEAGWVLAPWAHGRGYAAEAVSAMLAWADATLAAPRIVCMIHPENQPSLNLAARMGFAPYAETRYHDDPITLLERKA